MDHLLLNKCDVLGSAEVLLEVKHPDEVSDHRDLLFGGGLHSELLHTVESVAHDGDQQVHEDQLRDESGKEEEDPNQSAVLLPEVVHAKLSKTDQVRSDEGINKWHAKDRLIDWSVNALKAATLIEEQHRVAKHAHTNDQEGQERNDVNNDLSEHTNERGSLLEQAEPVEELDVQEEDRDGTCCLLVADMSSSTV